MTNRPRPRFRTELDPAEELDLIRRAQAGDQRAYARLFAANAAYLRSQARLYRNCGLDLEDLEQEARAGLAAGIARFDPDAGVRLITYAKFWIQNRLRDAALSHGRLIRLPRLVHQGIARSYRAGEDLDAESLVAGGYVSDEKTAKAAAPLWGQRPRSFDAEASSPNNIPLRERLRAMAPTPEEALAEAETEAAGVDLVADLVRALSRSDRSLIQRRYLDEEPATLQQIADDRGCSRENIRQHEVRILRQLRARAASRMGDLGP